LAQESELKLDAILALTDNGNNYISNNSSDAFAAPKRAASQLMHVAL
jgi:hypothetical protein